MKRKRRGLVPWGYVGEQGYKQLSDASDRSRLFMAEGPIPLGERGFRLLRHGDKILFKRTEDRKSAKVPFALVEVVGSPGTVLIEVLFHESYSGTIRQVPRGGVHEAASYELFWDKQTPVNPDLEEVLSQVEPQLL